VGEVAFTDGRVQPPVPRHRPGSIRGLVSSMASDGRSSSMPIFDDRHPPPGAFDRSQRNLPNTVTT
jgi:hypothetical protein